MPPCSRSSGCGCWGCLSRRQDSQEWKLKVLTGRSRSLSAEAGEVSDRALDLVRRIEKHLADLESQTDLDLKSLRVLAARLQLMAAEIRGTSSALAEIATAVGGGDDG